MKILLATNNKNKVKEIQEFYKGYEVYGLDEVITPFEILEDGSTFKENALIKARAVWQRLKDLGLEDEYVVLSDDSGLSVEALGNEPGIYSARYSGKGATDSTNRLKVIEKLHELNLNSSLGFYTACIGIVSKFGEFSVYGFMHGEVVDTQRGENGFGYDFIFIPRGYDRRISELSMEVKLKISHRSLALENAKYILNMLSNKTSSKNE